MRSYYNSSLQHKFFFHLNKVCSCVTKSQILNTVSWYSFKVSWVTDCPSLPAATLTL